MTTGSHSLSTRTIHEKVNDWIKSAMRSSRSPESFQHGLEVWLRQYGPGEKEFVLRELEKSFVIMQAVCKVMLPQVKALQARGLK